MDFYKINNAMFNLRIELVRAIIENIKSFKKEEYVFKECSRPDFYYCKKTKVMKIKLDENSSRKGLIFHLDDGTIMWDSITPLETLRRVLLYIDHCA